MEPTGSSASAQATHASYMAMQELHAWLLANMADNSGQLGVGSPASNAPAVAGQADICGTFGSKQQYFRCLDMLLKARLTMQSAQRDTIAIYVVKYDDKDPAGCQLLARIMAKLSQCSCSGCGQWGFLRSCARCKTTQYCSVGCQKAHYAAHKQHCQQPRQQHASQSMCTPWRGVSRQLSSSRQDGCSVSGTN